MEQLEGAGLVLQAEQKTPLSVQVQVHTLGSSGDLQPVHTSTLSAGEWPAVRVWADLTPFSPCVQNWGR